MNEEQIQKWWDIATKALSDHHSSMWVDQKGWAQALLDALRALQNEQDISRRLRLKLETAAWRSPSP